QITPEQFVPLQFAGDSNGVLKLSNFFLSRLPGLTNLSKQPYCWRGTETALEKGLQPKPGVAVYTHETHPLVVRKVFRHGLRISIKVIARHIITEKQMANGRHMGVSVGVDGRYRKKAVGFL